MRFRIENKFGGCYLVLSFGKVVEIFALTHSLGSHTSTHSFEDGTRATGWRERECRAPEYSTLVAGDTLKNPPSDKWHNERTIPNVRAPSVSPLQSK